tara:strand:- start:551 stop:802 length:252 start_codon:yes stop_codon:yes gene_type:complete
MKLKQCQTYSIYAYLLMTYVLGSVFYILITRTYKTPFKDAVSKYPELVKIKAESVTKRRNAFLIGICGAVILLGIVRPYGYPF